MTEHERQFKSATLLKVSGRGRSAEQLPSSLHEFVDSLALHSQDERAALLWDDQRRRWESGERPSVEMYVRFLPAPVIPEIILDLIYGEFMLRREAKENPNIEEYQRRFPEYAAQIARQLSLQAAFSVNDLSHTTRLEEVDTEKDVLPYPSEIAGYKIVAVLATGGQGIIYRALHPTLGRDVVIKLGRTQVKAALDTNDLVQEGRILAELDHPGLARVYDLRIHEGRPCLVMEFLRGRELEQDAHDRPRDSRAAAILVARVARALAVAHQRGVIHRDIKPRNILIDEAGNPHLIDFGLARIEDAWRHPGEAVGLSGTVSYMAPEQARGEPADCRSDLFGLGGVLYFLLTGRAPYHEANFNDVLARARHGEWDRAPLGARRIPAKLRAVVERAMATDPSTRYRTAAELADDLERFSRPPHTIWLFSAACAAVLALIAGLGLWEVSRPTRQSEGIIQTPGIRVAPDTKPRSFALHVRVWRAKRYVELVDSLPLSDRDEVRVETVSPAEMHASLFLLSSEGKLKRLAVASTPKEDTTLGYPADFNTSSRLTGPAGNELILLCARRSTPVDEQDLRALLSGCAAWPRLPEGSLLGLDPSGVRVIQASRDMHSIVGRPDPEGEVRRGLEELQRRLRSHFQHFEALIFSHGE